MRRRPLFLSVLLLLCLAGQGLAAAPAKAGPAAAPAPGAVWREPATGMEFVWVPAGAKDADPFSHHSRGACDWDEDCGWLEGFWLGRYEVTQGQWRAVMGANPSQFQAGDGHPVERVSLPDAREFVARLNAMGAARFALPRVAQWRYAAKHSDRLHGFAGGNAPDPLAWHKGNSGGATHKVGTKAPNGLGIYDLHGNVAEWCAPETGPLPPALAAELPPPAPVAEPVAPVLGGGFDDPPQHVESLRIVPETERSPGIGLRLLRLPGEGSPAPAR